jgi:hypothetical protein
MNYKEFLEKTINAGIQAAKADYPSADQKNKLEGSIAGFEACRGKTPEELKEVFHESVSYANSAYKERDSEKYWWFRCYQLEVEWVCNVISAVLYNEGKPPILSWLPTARGMMKAASILNQKI